MSGTYRSHSSWLRSSTTLQICSGNPAKSPQGITFCSRIVASLPDDTSVVPSGLNARRLTVPVWPVSGGPSCVRLTKSHRRTVLSEPADARVWPSLLKATSLTGLLWPVSGAPSCSRVRASHSRTMPSSLPEARMPPSGLKATLLT